MIQSSPEWNERYAADDTPWDSGKPSVELQRLLTQFKVVPCRTLELGCGTGTNAIYLAQQGFEVTGVDLAPVAIEQANKKATDGGVAIDLRVVDLTNPADDFMQQSPFDFVFDRGVYHVIRRHALDGLLRTLERVTRPGTLYIALTGNANDPNDTGEGPPRVAADELCGELGGLFRLVQLREFHFDEVVIGGNPGNFLAWSAILRRR
jgi:SAM-dependent methyltransferase